MGLSELFSWEDLSPGDAKFGPMEGKDKYEPGSGSAPPRRRSERLGKKPVRSFDSGTGFDVGFGFGDDDDESEKEKSDEKVKGRNKKRSLKRKNVDVVSGGDVAVDADVSVAKTTASRKRSSSDESEPEPVMVPTGKKLYHFWHRFSGWHGWPLVKMLWVQNPLTRKPAIINFCPNA